MFGNYGGNNGGNNGGKNGGNTLKKTKKPKKQEDKKQEEKDYGLYYDPRYNFNTFDKEFKRAASVESKLDVF